MAVHTPISTSEIGDKARRELLLLLEKVCSNFISIILYFLTRLKQVRGKKNLVIERSLAGPLGLFVKFSTLQEYGVDRVFFLENNNVDSSQKNVIFLARDDKAKTVLAIAGEWKHDVYHQYRKDHGSAPFCLL